MNTVRAERGSRWQHRARTGTTASMTELHVPVMLTEIVELLAPALPPADSGTTPLLVDCTLGLGGHAAALLEVCPQARLIGLDRDTDALAVAEQRLAPYADRVELVHAVYD